MPELTQNIPEGLKARYEPEPPRLTLHIEAPSAFRDMMESLEKYGVFIFALAPEPPLNATVAIEAVVPSTGREARVSGRVVSHMPTGTVMDLSISSPKEVEALKAILEPAPAQAAPGKKKPAKVVEPEAAVAKPEAAVAKPRRASEAAAEKPKRRESFGPVSVEGRAQALKALMEGRAEVDKAIRHWGPVTDMLEVVGRGEQGLLVAYDGRIRTLVLLRAGGLVEDVQVWPRPVPSGLSRMLAREGWLKEAELERVEARVEAEGIDVAAVLRDSRGFSDGFVVWAARARMESLLMDAFRARRGRLRFFPLAELPYQVSSEPLYLPWLAYRELSRQVSTGLAAEVQELNEQHKRHFPVRVEPAPFELKALEEEGRRHQWAMLTGRFSEARGLDAEGFPFAPLYLTPQFMALYDELTGEQRLWEVIRDAPVEEERAREAVTVMARLGLLDFETRCPIPLDQATQTRMDAVKAMRAAVDGEESPFDVLGVHWSEPEAVITSSYRSVLGRALPERFPSALRGRLYNDLSAIRERIAWANDQLATREQRAAVRERTVAPEVRERTFATLVLRTEVLMWRLDLERANGLCLKALELRPEHPTARAQLRQIALRKNMNKLAGNQRAGIQVDLTRTPLGLDMNQREAPSQRGLDDPELPIILQLMKRVAERGLAVDPEA